NRRWPCSRDQRVARYYSCGCLHRSCRKRHCGSYSHCSECGLRRKHWLSIDGNWELRSGLYNAKFSFERVTGYWASGVDAGTESNRAGARWSVWGIELQRAYGPVGASGASSFHHRGTEAQSHRESKNNKNKDIFCGSVVIMVLYPEEGSGPRESFENSTEDRGFP